MIKSKAKFCRAIVLLLGLLVVAVFTLIHAYQGAVRSGSGFLKSISQLNANEYGQENIEDYEGDAGDAGGEVDADEDFSDGRVRLDGLDAAGAQPGLSGRPQLRPGLSEENAADRGYLGGPPESAEPIDALTPGAAFLIAETFAGLGAEGVNIPGDGAYVGGEAAAAAMSALNIAAAAVAADAGDMSGAGGALTNMPLSAKLAARLALLPTGPISQLALGAAVCPPSGGAPLAALPSTAAKTIAAARSAVLRDEDAQNRIASALNRKKRYVYLTFDD
ncbi:MAG: hypothetical protein LBU58_00675, partial [Clostridiales bacterium]|nr:hypothetical protein [Clostridiales bacterium]